MLNFLRFIRKHKVFIFLILSLTVLSYIISSISPALPQTHYTNQAYSFLHGRLDIIHPDLLFDDVLRFNGKIFVYYNPVPAIFYMPLVAIFGERFPQQILVYVATFINFILTYKISKKYGLSQKNSLWLTSFFIFGTIYLHLALTTITAYHAQIFGCMFLLFALNEFLSGKRWFFIGVFIALAGGTRALLFLAVFFFIFQILKTKLSSMHKTQSLLFLLYPIYIMIVLLGAFNLLRFGNPLETGYGMQTYVNPIYSVAKSYGDFSPIHIPGNIYFLLFRGPDAIRQDQISYVLKPPYLRINEWGLSIIFTSPLFLYLIFNASRKNPFWLSSYITIFIMLIPILSYFNSGIWQYGYRYALDVYPLLFLLLLFHFKEHLPPQAKALIIYSILFNLLFMYSIWDRYPFPL